MQVAQQRPRLHLRQTGVALLVSAFQPLEGAIGVVQVGKRFGNLQGAVIGTPFDRLLQRGFGLGELPRACRAIAIPDRRNASMPSFETPQCLIQPSLLEPQRTEHGWQQACTRVELEGLIQRGVGFLQQVRVQAPQRQVAVRDSSTDPARRAPRQSHAFPCVPSCRRALTRR